MRSWLSASVLRIWPRWLSLPMSGKLTQRESFFTVRLVSSFLVFLMTSTWWLPSSRAAENESECGRQIRYLLFFFIYQMRQHSDHFSLCCWVVTLMSFSKHRNRKHPPQWLWGLKKNTNHSHSLLLGVSQLGCSSDLFPFLSRPSPHTGLPWAVFLSCSTRETGWVQGSEPGRRTSLQPVLTLSSYWRNTATERWGSTVSVTEMIQWFPEGCEINLRTWLREWERKQYTFNYNEPFIGFKDFLSFCLMAFCLTWTCLLCTWLCLPAPCAALSVRRWPDGVWR